MIKTNSSRRVLQSFISSTLTLILGILAGRFAYNSFVLGILSIFFIGLLILLKFVAKPKVRVNRDEIIIKPTYDRVLPYEGLIAVVSPILSHANKKREDKLAYFGSIENQELKDAIEKDYTAPNNESTKQYAPIITIAEQCKHLKYVWLLTTEAINKEKPPACINTSEDAALLERVLRSMYPNIIIRKGLDKDPYSKQNYHFKHKWEATLIDRVYKRISHIYDMEIGRLNLAPENIITIATNGVREVGFGIMLASLSRDYDIALSIEDTKEGSINYVCKYEVNAELPD